MKNNKKEIKISEEDSTYVEKCWYEWDGIQKILGYITKNNVCIEHLNYYTNLALEKNYILETAKSEVIKKYIPLDINIKFEYEFNFSNFSIIYWEV